MRTSRISKRTSSRRRCTYTAYGEVRTQWSTRWQSGGQLIALISSVIYQFGVLCFIKVYRGMSWMAWILASKALWTSESEALLVFIHFSFLKLSRRYIQNPKKFKTIHLKQEVPRSLFSRSTSGAKCSETESCHKKHALLWGYRVCTDVKWREIYQTIKGLWSKAPFCDPKFETKKLIDLMAGRCAFLEESCFFFGNYLDFFIFPSF